jgi:hypothetical protein
MNIKTAKQKADVDQSGKHGLDVDASSGHMAAGRVSDIDKL